MKRLTCILYVALLANIASGQNCFRFTYLQQQKRSVDEASFHGSEMKLDFDGKSAFFYNEVSFMKDSLDVLAFDENGNVADQEAYSKRSRLSGSAINDKSWIDFSGGSYTLYYFDMIAFYGTMPMELPQWNLTDEQDEQSGYQCKKAQGVFLGREWTIWYTEEIPVNIGPWLLWGTPGLIVYAEDAENIVNFRLLGVERIGHGRLEDDNSYRKARESKSTSRVYTLPMKEMEVMHSRYRRDMDYFAKVNGIVSLYNQKRDGSRNSERIKPYIPLIPDAYWQKK
jgi:GLPGLI family protein